MKKTIAVLLVDGFADWEIGPVLPAARHYFGAAVVTASLDGNAVRSIGGLLVQPERRLADLKPAAAHLWLLPGSVFWAKGPRAGLSEALQARAKAGKPIAAICGATLALGHAGLLDHHAHTSNSLDFLKKAPRLPRREALPRQPLRPRWQADHRSRQLPRVVRRRNPAHALSRPGRTDPRLPPAIRGGVRGPAPARKSAAA